jgi:hypothetical protein
VAAGPPLEVLTPALIERVWKARADVHVRPGSPPSASCAGRQRMGWGAIGIPYGAG